MRQKILRLGALLLSLFLLGGGTVLSAAGETARYRSVTEIKNTYRYVLVTKDLRVNRQGKQITLLSAPSQETGLQCGEFSAAAGEEDGDIFWQILPSGKNECYLRALSGENAGRYVNLSSKGASLGDKQRLTLTRDEDGAVQFSVMEGQTRIYLRFLSSRTQARFVADEIEEGSKFTLYRRAVRTEGAPEADPLLTIACVSDLHIDYGIQVWNTPMRQSVIDACTALQAEEPDILLVGGDLTSDNAKMAGAGGWSRAIFENVRAEIDKTLRIAAPHGRILYAAGNHEFQAGAVAGYDAYDYEELMTSVMGEFQHAYYQKDDPTLSEVQYPDHLLGFHYEFEGCDFIVINPVFATVTYSEGTLNWLKELLASIDSSHRIFLMTHLPLLGSRNLTPANYGVAEDDGGRELRNILLPYSNVVYLYGHNHGQGDTVYIHEDTFERITPYRCDGSVIDNAEEMPDSFVSAFMGSMSYYMVRFYDGWLGAASPSVVQALMIYVYEDRVEFSMKNYGSQNGGSEELRPYVLSAGLWEFEAELSPEQADIPAEASSVPVWGVALAAVAVALGAALGAGLILRKKR